MTILQWCSDMWTLFTKQK